jgi:hypothetical protein
VQALLDEGFAVEIVAVRKSLKKASKYEKRALGGYTPSLADPELMASFLSTVGQALFPESWSVFGWFLGRR